MHEAAKYAAKAWLFLQQLKTAPKEDEPLMPWDEEATRKERIALPDSYVGKAPTLPTLPTLPAPITTTLRGNPTPPRPAAITKPAFTMWDDNDSDPEEW